MNGHPDSALSLTPPTAQPPAWREKLFKILRWTFKILLLLILLPLVSLLAVGWFDYQVVSIVGGMKNPKVIRQSDIAMSMAAVSETMNTKRPDVRFERKNKWEQDNLITQETRILRLYLSETGDTEHLSLSDPELHDWGRTVGSAGAEVRMIRRPTGLQGYRWWMKENHILFLGFL